MYGIFRRSGKLAWIFYLTAVVIIGAGFYLLVNHNLGSNRNKDEAVHSISLFFDLCDQEKSDRERLYCLRDMATDVLDQYGLSQVMTALETRVIQKNSENPVPKCHTEAHILGAVSGESMDNLGEVMVQCGRSCGYGCVHGAALGALRKDPGILDRAASICLPFVASKIPGQDLTACNHGLGHGFTEIAGRDPADSFLLCDRLNSANDKQECATGVFMELFETSVSVDQAVIELPNDLSIFCKTIPIGYQKWCRNKAGTHEYRKTQNTGQARKACENLEVGLVDSCFGSLGAYYHFIFNGNVVKIWEGCQASEESETRSCLFGALGSTLVTDSSGALGRKLCSLSSGQIRTACLKRLDDSLEQIYETP